MLKRALLFALTLSACTNGPDDPEALEAQSAAVIGGVLDPAELGFDIHPLQANATLGQIAHVGGNDYQGCSATLIGDRVVLTAGHCIVMNQDAWLDNGAAPHLAEPSEISYVVGNDVNAPLCRLQASEVHLHPDIEVSAVSILHDAAMIILEASAMDTCEYVVPISPNREPLTDAMFGEMALQGGFGSLAESYAFSPIKYWSLLEVVYLSDSGDSVLLKEVGHGGPAPGDSGSGSLYRFPDGRLRTIGIDSVVVGLHGFVRVDNQLALLDTVPDPSMMCGPVSDSGMCGGTAIVSCDASGFLVTDCPAGKTCVQEPGGAAVCADCTCGQGPACDPNCACDPDCPCECDVTAQCDDGCACDPACHESVDAGVDAPLDVGVDAIEQEDGANQANGSGMPPAAADESGGGCATRPGAPRTEWLALLGLGWWAIRRRRVTNQ